MLVSLTVLWFLAFLGSLIGRIMVSTAVSLFGALFRLAVRAALALPVAWGVSLLPIDGYKQIALALIASAALSFLRANRPVQRAEYRSIEAQIKRRAQHRKSA